MFYYIAGMQVGSTIAVFIQQKISLGEIHLNLPASVFASLYTVLIILFSPGVNYIWAFLKRRDIDFSLFHKLSLGVGLGGAGLICFALATLVHMPLTMIILGIAFLSLGELILAPAIYTSITNYSPPYFKTSMMGCWLLFVALGGYLSSSFTRLILHFTKNYSNTTFNVFMISGLLVIVSAIVLYCIRKNVLLQN